MDRRLESYEQWVERGQKITHLKTKFFPQLVISLSREKTKDGRVISRVNYACWRYRIAGAGLNTTWQTRASELIEQRESILNGWYRPKT